MPNEFADDPEMLALQTQLARLKQFAETQIELHPVTIPSGKLCKGIQLSIPLGDGAPEYNCRRCAWDGEICESQCNGDDCHACGRIVRDAESVDIVDAQQVIPVHAAQCFIPSLGIWQLIELPDPPNMY